MLPEGELDRIAARVERAKESANITAMAAVVMFDAPALIEEVRRLRAGARVATEALEAEAVARNEAMSAADKEAQAESDAGNKTRAEMAAIRASRHAGAASALKLAIDIIRDRAE